MNTGSNLAARSEKREYSFSRTLQAQREIVFNAWIDPKQVAAWWGPNGFTNPVCEMDVRPGGKIHIDMRGPDGAVYPMKGVFNEIDTPKRLIFTSSAIEDEKGDPQIETLNTVTFVGLGDKTRLTMHAKVVKSTPAAEGTLEGMEEGWNQSLDRLDGLFEKALPKKVNANVHPVTNVNTAPQAEIESTPETTTNVTRGLLISGVVAGPLFIGMSLVQVFTRQGFDLTRHPISMLSLGGLGWIQIANFVLSGLLAMAGAVGMWRLLHPGRGGTWGPLLVGAYGVGLIAAGVFSADPGFGFPPGAPEGMPTAMSWHAMLHGIAFFVSVPSLIAASFVFARRFATLRQRGWAAYCAATGVVALALIALGFTNSPGVPLFVMAAVTSAWLAVITVRLLAERKLEGSR